jgi:hypothetical protein
LGVLCLSRRSRTAADSRRRRSPSVAETAQRAGGRGSVGWRWIVRTRHRARFYRAWARPSHSRIRLWLRRVVPNRIVASRYHNPNGDDRDGGSGRMGVGVQVASGGIALAPVRDASRVAPTATMAAETVPPVAGVSIVVPVYNEEGNLRELHRRVAVAMERIGLPWELIVVDDGSRDGGWAVLREIVVADDRVKGLRHRRNFGKARALTTGFAAVGHGHDLVVTMDGDLQDDPRRTGPLRRGHRRRATTLSPAGSRSGRTRLGKTQPSKLFNAPPSAASPASSSTTSTAASRRTGSRSSPHDPAQIRRAAPFNPGPRQRRGFPHRGSCRSPTTPAAGAAPSTAGRACRRASSTC